MIGACHIRLAELEGKPLQQGIESGDLHRLEEIVCEAGLASRLTIARATPPTDGDEDCPMPGRFQVPGDLEPTEPGHADVEQRQMRSQRLRSEERRVGKECR